MRYYTYTYSYPLEYPDQLLANTVFYVGKGCGDRIHIHLREAVQGGTSRKCIIIRDIWHRGLKPICSKVFETNDEQSAFIYEWALINLIYGYENLANICEGGNGGNGGRSSSFYKLVSITLPTELTDKIGTCYTYTGYIRELLSYHLASVNAIEFLMQISLPERKRIPGVRANRHTMCLQLPLDIAANLELFPLMKRSLLVEYLARKDLDFHIDR